MICTANFLATLFNCKNLFNLKIDAMSNFTMFLLFILVLTAMFMTFPERARKATKCLIQLVGALLISRAFQVMTAYFNRK